MEIGTTLTPSYIAPNRDGLTPVRLVQCAVSVPTDLRTIQLIGNVDDSPVVGSKILILPVESAWECGITLESILPSALTLVGDKVIAASTAVGVPSPLSQVSLRAVPNATGGQIELGGITDWVVAFTDMQTAFNQLRTDFNNLVTDYNAHVHGLPIILDSLAAPCTVAPIPLPAIGVTVVAPPPAPSPAGIPSAADMSLAKVMTVQVP